MAKFKVLRAIEHHLCLYVSLGTDAPEKVKSVAHGGDIPVNASGTIELSDAEAAVLTRGQVERIEPPEAEQAKGRNAKSKG